MTNPEDRTATAALSAIASLQDYLNGRNSTTAAIQDLFEALNQLTENPTAQSPRYALVELPDADTSSLGGPRFYGGANPRFYLQADTDGDIIDRDGTEYGTPTQVRSLAAAFLAVAAYVERTETTGGEGTSQPLT